MKRLQNVLIFKQFCQTNLKQYSLTYALYIANSQNFLEVIT